MPDSVKHLPCIKDKNNGIRQQHAGNKGSRTREHNGRKCLLRILVFEHLSPQDIIRNRSRLPGSIYTCLQINLKTNCWRQSPLTVTLQSFGRKRVCVQSTISSISLIPVQSTISTIRLLPIIVSRARSARLA